MLNKLSRRLLILNFLRMDAQVLVIHHTMVYIREVPRLHDSRVVQCAHNKHPQIEATARMPVENLERLQLRSGIFGEIT